MHFAEFQNVHCFWLVVCIAFFLIWAYRFKQRRLERYSEKPLLRELAGDYRPHREIVRGALLAAAFAFSALALMRPQWGYRWQEIKREGLDILIAMDTSKSMLTDDVKPSRLERSKLAVRDLLQKLSGDRVGLIAFAGTAFTVCPLTVDYGGFLLSLDDLNTQTIPQGGTDVASAIAVALKGYEQVSNKYKAVIIITDGENLEGDPLKMAREAKDKGIRIFCVGIGTKEGELIRVKSENGQYEFLKDNKGNFVKSRLNEDLLQQIALVTDGTYVHAAGADFGFDVIFDRLSQMEKREIKASMEKRYHERFQWPLAAAIFLVMVETLFPMRTKRC